MGNFFSNLNMWPKSSSNNDIVMNYETAVDETMKNACMNLKEMQQLYPDTNCQSSMTYLERTDVKQQLLSICEELKIVALHPKINSALNLAYLEIEAESKIDVNTNEHKTFELNFWPCNSCVCIGVKEIKK